MKKLFSIALLLGSLMLVKAQETGIKFNHENWETTLAIAKKENKLIFLDAYTTWCGPCKWMAKNVFTNDSVAQFYNKNFICVKMDMEKGDGTKLGKQYKINKYPTLMYINADESVVLQIAGSRSTTEFLQDGKKALDNGTVSLSTLQNKLNTNTIKSNEALTYFEMLINAGMDHSPAVTKYINTQKDIDLATGANWIIFFRYIRDINSPAFIYFQNNQKIFADLHTRDSVDLKLEQSYDIAMSHIADKNSTIAFADLEAKINAAKFKAGDKIISKGQIILYKDLKQWDKFAESALGYFEKYIPKHNVKITNTKSTRFERIQATEYENAEMIDKVARKVCDFVTDKSVLSKIATWSKLTTEMDDNYDYNNTYAMLLLKTGNKAEAMKIAQHCIEIGEKQNIETNSAKAILEQIKNNK